MNLADQLTALQAEDDAIKADLGTLNTNVGLVATAQQTEAAALAALQAQIAVLQAGVPATPEQLAALGQIASDLGSVHEQIAAANAAIVATLPPVAVPVPTGEPVPPVVVEPDTPPPGFFEKIAGETYHDYLARAALVGIKNALSSDAWGALPDQAYVPAPGAAPVADVPGPDAPVPGFVTKIDGETYDDYKARANAADEDVVLGPDEWAAAPVDPAPVAPTP